MEATDGKVLDSLSLDVSRSYLRTVDALSKFFDRNSTSELLDTLENIKLEPHQSLKLFGVRISKLVKKLYPGNDEKVNERIVVNYFIRGLDPEVGRRLRIRKPETLAYAMNKAEIISEELKTKTTEKTTINAIENENKGKEIVNLLGKINEKEKNISSLLEKQKQYLNTIDDWRSQRSNVRKTENDKEWERFQGRNSNQPHYDGR